ncbi:MAG: superoxide dismutase family protein [Sphingobacteriales bacterium]
MKRNINNTIKISGLLATIIIFSFSTCKKDNTVIKKAEAHLEATNTLTPVNGLVTFTQVDNGKVKMQLEIIVPSRAGQSVAIHIHEHGMCGNAGGDAHGHWNPKGASHGKWGSTSYHAGDIGNIPLDANGKGRLVLETDLWSIGGSDTTKNILHRGIIVHGGIDDYLTQPAGNSGPRIGCGEIHEH